MTDITKITKQEVKKTIQKSINKIKSGSAQASDYFHPITNKLIGEFVFIQNQKDDKFGKRYNCYWVHPNKKLKTKIRNPKVNIDDIILKYRIGKEFDTKDEDKKVKACNIAFDIQKSHKIVQFIKEFESGFLRMFGAHLLTKPQSGSSKGYKNSLLKAIVESGKNNSKKYDLLLTSKGKYKKMSDTKPFIKHHKKFPHLFAEKVAEAVNFKTMCQEAWPLDDNLEEEEEGEEDDDSIKFDNTESLSCLVGKIKISINKETDMIYTRPEKFFGVSLINHTKKLEMSKAKQKLEKYKLVKNSRKEKEEMYETRYKNAASDYLKSEKIRWSFDNINTNIPASTKIKRLIFNPTSAYVGSSTVSCQCNAFTMYYTEETTRNEINDSDLYAHYDDSSESEDEDNGTGENEDNDEDNDENNDENNDEDSN